MRPIALLFGFMVVCTYIEGVGKIERISMRKKQVFNRVSDTTQCRRRFLCL